MNLFKKLIYASTIGTYVVIFVGGLVRVSGAGLGCPDWPQCFGRWFPPTSIDQLPAHIDSSKFNLVLAWIEYVNHSNTNSAYVFCISIIDLFIF